MKCKCGDEITESDIKRINTFPLLKHNVPNYPRCRACLNILSFGLHRLVKHNSQYEASYAQYHLANMETK